MAILTDRTIRAMRAKGTRRLVTRDTKVRGLVIRVTPAGAKTFSVWYRAAGTARQYTLGPFRFPATRGDGLTLTEARDQAEKILARVRLGEDPEAARIRARDEAKRLAAQPEPAALTWADWWTVRFRI
jgi:hypothetical protein